MEQFKKYLLTVDKSMSVLSAEEAFLRYIGRDSINNLDQVVPPQDLMQLRNAIFAIDPGKLGLSCFRIRTSQGTLNWIAANIEKRRERDELIQMELSDIQSLKIEGTLSQYDEMTGILNKHAICNYAVTLTERYPRKSFYFCLMDIDHFKNVNDTFGHLCGDDVIIDVAHILHDHVGADGMVGRIGGDEFMLVLEKISSKPRVREVLAGIREAVETKYKKYKGSMDITVSIGCALYPDFAMNYDQLFRLTDKMLYLAKAKGRNRYIIYTPEIHGPVDADVDTKIVTAAHKTTTGGSKLQLMLDMLTRFMHSTDMSYQMAIEKILVAYDLDEVYIFTGGAEKSRYGVVRIDMDEEDGEIEEAEGVMPFLNQEEFQALIDENGIGVVNIFDLNREKYPQLHKAMEETQRRFLLAFRIHTQKGDGFVVYTSKRENSRRLSESDILDLIYFSKMVELTSSVR